MSCIVGIVEKDHVVIGGDSAASIGTSITTIKDPKVFKVGSWLFGCAGSFRFMQLMKYSFKPPKLATKEIHRYLCTEFVTEIMNLCETGGINKIENGKFGSMLIGYNNRLFELDSDMQIMENINGISSIGSGSDIALGSLYTSIGVNAHQRCLKALEASDFYCTGVSKPFTILRT
jgi:ATP-dependent protease HslVU (ClpYQ) peptidase subunit